MSPVPRIARFGMEQIFRSTDHIGLRIAGSAHTTTALTLIPAASIEPITSTNVIFEGGD